MFHGTISISSLSPGHKLPSSHTLWHIQRASEQKGGQRTTTGSERTNAKGQEHQRQIVPETMGTHIKQSDEQCSRPKTSSLLYWLVENGIPRSWLVTMIPDIHWFVQSAN